MEICDQHRDLVSRLRPIILPWRKLTIAIDGVDNSGKSTLGRFLAWQLGMPLIETDLLLKDKGGDIDHDLVTLTRLLKARHDLNRPAIVEGVLIMRTLESISVRPEFLIYVEAAGREGSEVQREAFKAYAAKYRPRVSANYTFRWSPEHAS
jgi:uridine kinase